MTECEAVRGRRDWQCQCGWMATSAFDSCGRCGEPAPWVGSQGTDEALERALNEIVVARTDTRVAAACEQIRDLFAALRAELAEAQRERDRRVTPEKVREIALRISYGGWSHDGFGRRMARKQVADVLREFGIETESRTMTAHDQPETYPDPDQLVSSGDLLTAVRDLVGHDAYCEIDVYVPRPCDCGIEHRARQIHAAIEMAMNTDGHRSLSGVCDCIVCNRSRRRAMNALQKALETESET